MKALVRIDAAPGFEDSVEAAVSQMDRVLRVIEDNDGNYDLVAALEAEDANGIQDLKNAITHESGVQGLRLIDTPEDDLLERMRSA